MSPSQTVNGLLSTATARRRKGCLRSAQDKQDKSEVGLLGEFGAIGSGCRGRQPPEVISAVGRARQAADAGLTVVHDRTELGVAERVPAELATRRQEGDQSTGVRSVRGALPTLPLVGFPEPPPEPAVRLSTQRALHKSQERLGFLSSGGRPGAGDRCPAIWVACSADLRGVEQLSSLAGRPPSATAVNAPDDGLPCGRGMFASRPADHPHPHVVGQVSERDVQSQLS